MSRFLDAIACRPVDQVPVWLMRQAGRYLPEYRAIRERHSFMTMIQTPEIAAEITLQPLRRYGFDAAILFSDILTVAQALGGSLSFVEGKGPVIANPVRTREDVNRLSADGLRTQLGYVRDAIHLLKQGHLGDTPLIGFAGAPFTVASYMIEGGSSSQLGMVKRLFFNHPDVMNDLIDRLVLATADYVSMQIEAGVDAIQLFDTWALHLSLTEFEEWVMAPLRAVLNRIRNPKRVPITVFARGSAVFWQRLATLPIQCISLDWQVDIGAVGQLAPPPLALQGNLDPMLLTADPSVLTQRIRQIMESVGHRPGYIFNLGHGITPDVPLEQVQRLVDAVRSFVPTPQN